MFERAYFFTGIIRALPTKHYDPYYADYNDKRANDILLCNARADQHPCEYKVENECNRPERSNPLCLQKV